MDSRQGTRHMIAATRNVVTGARKDPSPQVVEVRLVIDLRLPPGIHAMSPPGLDGMTQQTVTVQAVVPKESSVDQDVQVPSFIVTSSESVEPAEVVISETKPSAEDVRPDDATGETLLEFYRANVKAKRAKSAGPAAIAEHESAMRAFDSFFQRFYGESAVDAGGVSKNHRFSTPKAFLQSPDALSVFARHLIFDEGLSPSTVCKRLTNLGLLKRPLKMDLEKPTPGEVKRLYSEHMRSVAESSGQRSSLAVDRRIPSFQEIDAICRVVSIARYPYEDHAPYFWRGWIRFLAFIGPRSRDVVSVVTHKQGLLKEHVIFESLCPSPDVNNALGYELHSPHGWLWYVIGKDQHSDCRKILFPMPLWMRNWIRFFYELSPCDRIFPSVMQKKIGFLSQTQMTREWNALLASARVDSRLVPSEGTGDRIALRKFASNWWSIATSNSQKYSALADKMENYVLHHVPKSTSKKHYISDQAKLLPVMLELLPSWPVPAADAPHVSLLPE